MATGRTGGAPPGTGRMEMHSCRHRATIASFALPYPLSPAACFATTYPPSFSSRHALTLTCFGLRFTMSAKKLRSKLDLKFMRPLARPSTAPRSPGISADFSEKMFRRHETNPTVIHVDAQSPPPPPPPKDKSSKHYSLYNPTGSNWDDVRYAVLASPTSDSDLDDSPVRTPPTRSKITPLPGTPSSSPPAPPKSTHTRAATSRIPVASGRVMSPTRQRRTVSSPEETELRRREAQRLKELEEREAVREEAERQARLKREKEQMLEQAAHEEATRKAALEQELRRAAEERRKREAIEQEAEALAAMVAAERKRQERERRRLEAQKLQRMRQDIQEQRRAQEDERRSWRERVAMERKELAWRLETQKTKNSRGLTVLLTGWVTVQSEDFLSYKRRFFHLREDAFILFKDAEVS